MATYKIQRMCEGDYHNYMCGYMDGYSIEDMLIEADTREEAIAKAQKPGYIVNDYAPSLGELEQERKEQQAKREREEALRKERSERAKKAIQAKNEAEAKRLGITLDQLAERKKLESELKKQKRKELEAQNQIDALKEDIRYWENRLKQATDRTNELREQLGVE